jgi:predicted 3-demethylubiquinone-9 3-methyltransferase (glyoxalase superfamily)
MTTGKLWSMRRVVLFKALVKTTDHPSFRSYSETFSNGKKITSETLQAAESKVKDNDVVNIQFTSGECSCERY